MSVQKKGDDFYAVVYYRDDLGKAHHKWVKAGKSQKEAERLERRLRADLDAGNTAVISSGLQLGAFLDKWLEDVVAPSLAPSTYDNYKYAIKSIKQYLEHIPVAKLRPAQIRKWVNTELAISLKPTTVNNHYHVLNRALTAAAQEYRLIPSSPCAYVKGPGTNTPKNGAYTQEQVQLLLDIMQHTNIYVPVLLGVLVGLRRGEICGLTWDVVNLEQATADIAHSLDRVSLDKLGQLGPEYTVFKDAIKTKRAKSALVLGPTKTEKSAQSVVLPELVVKELRALELEQRWQKQQLGPAYKGHGFVCCWPDGTPLDPDYVYHKFKKTVEAYNETKPKDAEPLPVLRVHDLRHTQATLLLGAHVDVKVVSRVLRHKRSSFTQDVYQHVLENMQRQPASIMDSLFKVKNG